MERKRSSRRGYAGRRRKPLGEKIKDFLRNFIAFMFSNVGIIGLVVGYTIVGALIFQEIEGEESRSRQEDLFRERNATALRLWNLTCCGVGAFEEHTWRNEVSAVVHQYQERLVTAIKTQGFGGVGSENWSFSGAFLYSLTVITTIGYGNVTPHTEWGKMVTVLYAIIGMPLFLLYLSNIGDILAKSFKWTYAKLWLCRACPGARRRKALQRSASGVACRPASVQSMPRAIDYDDNHSWTPGARPVPGRRIAPGDVIADPARDWGPRRAPVAGVYEVAETRRPLNRARERHDDGRRSRNQERDYYDDDMEPPSPAPYRNIRRSRSRMQDPAELVGRGRSRSRGREVYDDERRPRSRAGRFHEEQDEEEEEEEDVDDDELPWEQRGRGGHGARNKARGGWEQDRARSRSELRDRASAWEQDHMDEEDNSWEDGQRVKGKSNKANGGFSKSVDRRRNKLNDKWEEDDLEMGYRARKASRSRLQQRQRRIRTSDEDDEGGGVEDELEDEEGNEDEDDEDDDEDDEDSSEEDSDEEETEETPSSADQEVSEEYPEDACHLETAESSSVSEKSYDPQTVTVPVTLCLAIMVGYVCGGAVLFGEWEDWGMLDGSYFCFISLSTIGFGDIVPGSTVYSSNIELSFIFCSMYLMLGMALIAMCFNLMQEEVIHKMRSCMRTLRYVTRCNRRRATNAPLG